MYSCDGLPRFDFFCPAFGDLPYKAVTFQPDFTAGKIYLNRALCRSGQPVNALEYPLDELLMTNLLARNRGMEVHACGVVDRDGWGHLFVGHSGAGKTTMARLWQQRDEVRILSDDRIILRHIDERIWMYGTPWHGEAELASNDRAPLRNIFFLRQANENEHVRTSSAKAAALLFSCAFPPFHCLDGLDSTLRFLEHLTNRTPCHELRFTPDSRAMEYILGSSFETV